MGFATAYARSLKKRPSRIAQGGRSPRAPAPPSPHSIDDLLGWPGESRKWWEQGAEPPSVEELARFLQWLPDATARVREIRSPEAREWALEELEERGEAFDRLPADLREKACNVYNGNNVPVSDRRNS